MYNRIRALIAVCTDTFGQMVSGLTLRQMWGHVWKAVSLLFPLRLKSFRLPKISGSVPSKATFSRSSSLYKQFPYLFGKFISTLIYLRDTSCARGTNLPLKLPVTAKDKWYPTVYIVGYQDNIDTYLLNWSLQPSRQDYNLASDINHVVCINFIHEW